ncbi:MAG: ammonium transporter [Deltaproteobacteria bacterium]|nr:ammonium transporter [Deltaproteobacteria bacterium]
MPQTSLDILWVLLCAGLVFLMQAGFVCLESGLTRSKNSINVAIKNLSDFSVSVILYWAFGFALMFGVSNSGWWGASQWFFNPPADSNSLLAFFLFQAMFCATAATILSGAVAERMKFKGYLLVVVLISGIFYPLFGHWSWGGILENTSQGWLKKLGFIDFAGSTVVHSLGGWMSLVTLIIIGPRLERYEQTKRNHKLKRNNIPLSVLGVLLLWLGWFGFNGGSTLAVKGHIALIITNTVLAGASGGVSALLLSWLRDKRPEVSTIMNGSLAGLVAITASCHAVNPVSSIIIGVIGGIVMLGSCRALEFFKIDDAVDAIPVHLGGGIWGTLALALFADLDLLGTGLNRWEQLQVQTLGILICSLWVLLGGFVLVYFINQWIPLRVSAQGEKLGLNFTEHGESTEMYSLLNSMESQAESGDLSLRIEVEPFTEAGEIGLRYNKILETLQEAEKNNELIIQNSLDAIVSMNESGTITAWNSQAEKIFGWTAQEAIGAKLTENIIPERFREAHNKGLERFLKSGAGPALNKRFEIHAMHKSGREFPIELAITPLKTSKGYFFSAFIRDITERKEFEANLNAAKEAAEAASLAKSQFLANMSHEIRTPMNGVMGMLQLALNTELNKDQQEYLELAHNSAESLLLIINDILDFSKIESGKLELNEMPFKINDMIDRILKLMSVNAEQKGLELHAEISPKISPILVGDAGRIQQVLFNLIGNAIKFTDYGEIILKIELKNQSKNNETLYVSIQDTGAGIPQEKIKDIFSAFSQVDVSNTRKHGGTGLGLAICSQLIAEMGGKIWVESEVGKGSNFQFYLPLQISHQQPFNHTESTSSELRNKKVLIVDDNASNRRILKDMLAHWQVKTTTAANGEEALSILEQSKKLGENFDYILLDFQMPNMDGVEVARKIENSGFANGNSILMLSSSDSLKRNELKAELGIQDFLIKPIRREDLFYLLTQRLTNTKSNFASKQFEKKDKSKSSQKVLLVEDNAINQKVMMEILKKNGHHVISSNNGQDALTQFEKNHPFDIILMDLQMPIMDGYTASKMIRESEKKYGEHSAIIALSADVLKGTREKCLDYEMDDYISKPIQIDALLEKIKEYSKAT